MKNLLALFVFTFTVVPWTGGLPPPTDFEALSSARRRFVPSYANLSSPVAGQILRRGKSFRVTLSDGATTATASEFALANSTGYFVIGTNLPFIHGTVDVRLTLPKWVADGTYDFVALENNGQASGARAYMDVVICTVFVGRSAWYSEFRTSTDPVLTHLERKALYLGKREPHLPKFLQPTHDQAIQIGQPFSINFINGEPDSDRARFVLRKIGASRSFKDIILTGNSSTDGQFKYKDVYTILAEVSFPKSVPQGPYRLMAQQVSPTPGRKNIDLASVDVQIIPTTMDKNSLQDSAPTAIKNPGGRSILLRSALIEKREPHPPKFLQPSLNQSIEAGHTFAIRFLDGEPDTDRARFVLRQVGALASPEDLVLTGPESSSGVYKFEDVFAISANVTCPKFVLPGTYTLVAQEIYYETNSRILDVASVTVQIVPNALDEDNAGSSTQEKALVISRNVFRDVSARPQSTKVEKRGLHPPFFNAPKIHQLLIPGDHFNIFFVHGKPSPTPMRFVLRSVDQANAQEVIIQGNNSTLDGFFDSRGFSVKAQVVCPKHIRNGNYQLVAQEHDPTRKRKAIDVKVIEVHVSHNKTLAVFPVDEASRKLEPTYRPTGSRSSPTILEPHPSQNVPSGSKFECKIQDISGSFQSVKFVLRAFAGDEYYLGSATFKDGFAGATVTCPSDIPFDSYSVVAVVNFVKRPKVFLDVVSTTVIVSHSIKETESGALESHPRRAPHPPKLISPVYNQILHLGALFNCQLLDGESTREHVRFLLRYDDDIPDLQIGQTDIINSLANATCQIPSSVVPGTYTFVAQENVLSRPEHFYDVKDTTVTVADPREPSQKQRSYLVQERMRSSRRSIENVRSQGHNRMDSKQASATLIQPTSYQNLVPGQSFDVKLKDATYPKSTMLKFFIRPLVTSQATEEYELGMSSNGDEAEEAVRCPQKIQNGTYLFVIQANSPEDPNVFFDSVSTPVLIRPSQTNNHESALSPV